MGLFDIVSDIYSSLSITEAHAEAPPAGASTKTADESTDDKAVNEKDVKEDEEEEKPSGEEEEEEEEEPVDPKEEIEEECKNSKECLPAKHHYDHCAERVAQQMEEGDGKAKEDCVEEFFHLAHCATACAAPKLWAKLK